MQYLYLIECQQFYKIGITNDVKSRLAQLSTGNPFELKLLVAYGFENANTVEAVIHQRFANTRKRGEWFELTKDDLVTFVNICQLLNGVPSDVLPTVSKDEEIQEAEVLAESSEGRKWDFAYMFSNGWRIEPANGEGWRWRNTNPPAGTPLNSSKIFMYGGLVKDLPHPIEQMNIMYSEASETKNE